MFPPIAPFPTLRLIHTYECFTHISMHDTMNVIHSQATVIRERESSVNAGDEHSIEPAATTATTATAATAPSPLGSWSPPDFNNSAAGMVGKGSGPSPNPSATESRKRSLRILNQGSVVHLDLLLDLDRALDSEGMMDGSDLPPYPPFPPPSMHGRDLPPYPPFPPPVLGHNCELYRRSVPHAPDLCWPEPTLDLGSLKRSSSSGPLRAEGGDRELPPETLLRAQPGRSPVMGYPVMGYPVMSQAAPLWPQPRPHTISDFVQVPPRPRDGQDCMGHHMGHRMGKYPLSSPPSAWGLPATATATPNATMAATPTVTLDLRLSGPTWRDRQWEGLVLGAAQTFPLRSSVPLAFPDTTQGGSLSAGAGGGANATPGAAAGGRCAFIPHPETPTYLRGGSVFPPSGIPESCPQVTGHPALPRQAISWASTNLMRTRAAGGLDSHPTVSSAPWHPGGWSPTGLSTSTSVAVNPPCGMASAKAASSYQHHHYSHHPHHGDAFLGDSWGVATSGSSLDVRNATSCGEARDRFRSAMNPEMMTTATAATTTATATATANVDFLDPEILLTADLGLLDDCFASIGSLSPSKSSVPPPLLLYDDQ